MSHNATNMYDVDALVAETYDLSETNTADLEQVRRLIAGRGPLRILEPFCGTGRILIPLALDGHEAAGLDQARAMLDRAREKITELPTEVRDRITFIEADATAGGWPEGFELVILGGNCFYELATPEEQEGCIASAAAALRPGGHVYVDNDHMEGDLDEAWRRPGVSTGWPNKTLADGTSLLGSSETIWFDAPRRLWRARRMLTVTFPDGTTEQREWVQQKHPVSVLEVRGWLEKHGFVVERHYGGSDDRPYTDDCSRATFWAGRA